MGNFDKRQNWPTYTPTQIWPARWKGRGILSISSQKTSVHYHSGSRFDGAWQGIIEDEYQFNNKSIMNAVTSYPSAMNVDFDESIGFNIFKQYQGTFLGFGITGTNRYGHPGEIIKTPRMIRLIHRGGWFGMEHYPMYIFPENEIPTSLFESVFLPTVTPDSYETGCIDYCKDLGNELIGYCHRNNIMFSVMACDQVDSGFQGQFSHGASGLDMSKHPFWYNEDGSGNFRGHAGHPARWLNNLHPYYPFPNAYNEFGLAANDLTNFPSKWNPSKMVVAGEILNIMFVTDGFSAYHGVDFNDYGSSIWAIDKSENDYPFATGSKEALQIDIDRCRDTYKRCRHYANIIVHSPKNAHFWPVFCQGINAGEGFGIPYCLTAAQKHLDDVTDKMSELNTQILIRRYSKRPSVVGVDKHAGNDFQLEWSEPQIPVSTIMELVRDFWQAV